MAGCSLLPETTQRRWIRYQRSLHVHDIIFDTLFQLKENMWTPWYGATTLTLLCWHCRVVVIWPYPPPTMLLAFAMMQPSPSNTARTWSTGPSKAMPFLGAHGPHGPTWTCGPLSFTLSTEFSPSTFPAEWRQRGNWHLEWLLQKTLATSFQGSRTSATPCCSTTRAWLTHTFIGVMAPTSFFGRLTTMLAEERVQFTSRSYRWCDDICLADE